MVSPAFCLERILKITICELCETEALTKRCKQNQIYFQHSPYLTAGIQKNKKGMLYSLYSKSLSY